MKILVVYFSKHGHAKRIGDEIAKALKADVETLEDTKDRIHLASWFKNAFDEDLRTPTKIKTPKLNPLNYDLVIVGTPIWDGIVPPVRAYLEMFKGKFKKVAFFSTFGASAENAFWHMEKACGKSPIATLEIQDRQVGNWEMGVRIKDFLGKLR